MKRTLVTLLVVTFLSTVHTALAGAIPWVGPLTGFGTITVPAGKVLVIEQISVLAPVTNTRFTLTGPYTGGIGPGSFTTDLNLGAVSGIIRLPSPLRLTAGMRITNSNNTVYTLTGFAVDAADYTAASPR